MRKNTRKDNTMDWPTKDMFTVNDIFEKYPNEKKITLRVRLQTAIDEDGMFAEIGSIPGGKGRPKKVYTKTPVTKEILDKAESQGINLVDNARETFVNAVSVRNTPPTSIPSVFKNNSVAV